MINFIEKKQGGFEMKVLVINSGSSSIKYQLLNMDNENVLAKGLVERIGIDGSRIVHKVNGEKNIIEDDIPNHEKGLKMVLDLLVSSDHGVLESLEEIDAVGHRVVHGGERFASSVRINKEVLDTIELMSFLAPLHNPANVMGIKASMELLPNADQVAVFDTSFHQTMPQTSYLYAIPYEYYEKYKIRRYGFHGTSHRYVAKRAAEILGEKPEDLKIITCHIGNGASVAAVKNGKSIDTSMGFTPLEGLAMGTRSGDLDPAIIEFICKEEEITPKEMLNILNKKSGMLGITKKYSDMRDIEDNAIEGEKVSRMAFDIYEYRIAKYIGAYAAAMNGVDAIVFTAGVGENSPIMREEIAEKYLGYLGVKIDKEINDFKGEEKIVSTEDSKVKLMVVPTNEELMIARDTKEIVANNLNELK
jgi:acetate kinase